MCIRDRCPCAGTGVDPPEASAVRPRRLQHFLCALESQRLFQKGVCKGCLLYTSKKALKQAEKRIIELDRLFTRLYEDNVSGKISDERFAVMSEGYEDEQKKLRDSASELTAYIETAEQKSADVTTFISVVKKYERITELTPEIMHELIEKIVVHAPDKSSGHRTQPVSYTHLDVYKRQRRAI